MLVPAIAGIALLVGAARGEPSAVARGRVLADGVRVARELSVRGGGRWQFAALVREVEGVARSRVAVSAAVLGGRVLAGSLRGLEGSEPGTESWPSRAEKPSVVAITTGGSASGVAWEGSRFGAAAGELPSAGRVSSAWIRIGSVRLAAVAGAVSQARLDVHAGPSAQLVVFASPEGTCSRIRLAAPGGAVLLQRDRGWRVAASVSGGAGGASVLAGARVAREGAASESESRVEIRRRAGRTELRMRARVESAETVRGSWVVEAVSTVGSGLSVAGLVERSRSGRNLARIRCRVRRAGWDARFDLELADRSGRRAELRIAGPLGGFLAQVGVRVERAAPTAFELTLARRFALTSGPRHDTIRRPGEAGQ